ncbi:Uncharacterised protein [Mycolicibacterium vanbaalenii]|uniref:Uncharacterized protein n=1 Tax=Mycolicibacterium vanbaalenii TaxID=110539 RepID=A0A5S9QTI0_MYCVN|nr:Uncharacterised protein [Mycolicibacterium vanbaalenii]
MAALYDRAPTLSGGGATPPRSAFTPVRPRVLADW